LIGGGDLDWGDLDLGRMFAAQHELHHPMGQVQDAAGLAAPPHL